MKDKENILFIINPISGYSKKGNIESQISKYLDHNRFNFQIAKTGYAGHARVIAREAVQDNINIIVAVGGDGTVNEIVNELIYSRAKLGIIPFGSGNGLGRHVGIPLNPKKAIETLNHGLCVPIDTCLINGFTFVNIAGIGFDAYISEVFNQSKQRGFITYIKFVIQHFYRYERGNFEFEIDGENKKQELLTIAFANSQQYGNNAYVAPTASIKDGFMDVVFVSSFPFYYWPVFILKTLTKKLHTSRYINTIRTKEFNVKTEKSTHMHVDGDYLGLYKEMQVKIQPKSLQLIVGRKSI